MRIRRMPSARFNMALVLARRADVRATRSTYSNAALADDPSDSAAMLLRAEQLIAHRRRRCRHRDAALAAGIRRTTSNAGAHRCCSSKPAHLQATLSQCAEHIDSPSIEWTARLRRQTARIRRDWIIGATMARRSRATMQRCGSHCLARSVLPSAYASADDVIATRNRFTDGLRASDREVFRRIGSPPNESNPTRCCGTTSILPIRARTIVRSQREFGTWWSAALNAAAPQHGAKASSRATHRVRLQPVPSMHGRFVFRVVDRTYRRGRLGCRARQRRRPARCVDRTPRRASPAANSR